ncbi:unnamed protein product [Ambrosiozyma monospora]|uniref:Unnamed protein product n=1 Tax=Ambrosiozyma monospora TaxID=43982 RepID=A0ACB5TZT8_AMBMO|nr:unnamed protein product [Ambrosiozyma monospora]
MEQGQSNDHLTKSPESPIHKNKRFQMISTQLLAEIAQNKFSSMFLHPVSKVDEPGYYNVIKRPVDLKTLTRDIKSGKIETFEELEFELQLMFSNAVMYNDIYQAETYKWTIEMMEEAKNLIEMFRKTVNES